MSEGILFLCIAMFVAYVGLGFLMAVLTIRIQTSKGYKKMFSVGFFFGPLAWLYYAAMPDLKMREMLEEKAKTKKKE